VFVVGSDRVATGAVHETDEPVMAAADLFAAVAPERNDMTLAVLRVLLAG